MLPIFYFTIQIQIFFKITIIFNILTSFSFKLSFNYLTFIKIKYHNITNKIQLKKYYI